MLVSKITKECIENEVDKLGLSGTVPEVFVFDELCSTNQWLIDHLKDDRSMLCVANVQTDGRGREGRSWLSPSGGIYMSFNHKVASHVCDYSAVSLVIGLVIVRVLRSEGVSNVKVKWPNDILIDGLKLAGVLIETKKVGGLLQLVIGIGINVQMSESSIMPGDINWSDLSGECIGLNDRDRIIALIINECNKVIYQFFEQGFSVFRDEWMSFDAYSGKSINILDQERVILSGIESGVDIRGGLQVLSGSELIKVHSGDVSLRINT